MTSLLLALLIVAIAVPALQRDLRRAFGRQLSRLGRWVVYFNRDSGPAGQHEVQP